MLLTIIYIAKIWRTISFQGEPVLRNEDSSIRWFAIFYKTMSSDGWFWRNSRDIWCYTQDDSVLWFNGSLSNPTGWQQWSDLTGM